MSRAKRKEKQTVPQENIQKSIAIQTDDIDSNVEIIRLHEQLKMLQLENDTLKKHLDGNPFSSKAFPDKTNFNETQSPQRINESMKGDSQFLKSASKQKTCTCKGNCSSKQCGCVKHQRKCGPTCKCNDRVCKNQESDNKENMGNVQNKIIRQTRQLENVSVKNGTERQNLFSPIGTVNETKFNDIQFEAISFDTQKELTYTSGEDSDEDSKKDLGGRVAVKVRDDLGATKGQKDKKKLKTRSDSEHISVTKRQIVKGKTRRNNGSKYDESEVQKDNKIKSEADQGFPLIEEDKEQIISQADISFDPMKPKHQLPRTPPRASNESESSNVSTVIETSTEKIEQNVERKVEQVEQKVEMIREELNQENVDLSKLNIEFVKCKKCKRGFYPWRVQVHESACHKL